ncbi:hypothetical protein [Curtobacterium herbarum]|uniref:Uncharacterized protein n=1 Tax=Curtobacterium herbarum TaxID=150122 RepID=A0ABP4K3R0_9MICO|nr:hypothetical protein [Curtobacterium herbarum]MBM7476117.1 hypothetical protein [Curtobacterium herbarum]MCS6544315.1 hypothetical protein [Curtobacterium herbarum]
MQWWNDLNDWTSSDAGWRVLSGAIIPFVAIVVAGIVAALIGRAATKRVVALQEREAKNAAVAGLVSAARKAANWGSLGHDERAYADHLAEDADIRLRLLPVAGAPIAANWAQHEIADIKKNSSTFSFQAEQSLTEFRDRILEWQARPGRARKLFKSDLERWKFDSPDPDADLIKRQQDWNADKVDSSRTPEPAPTPTTTSLRPAQPTVAPAADAGARSTAAASAGSSAAAPTQAFPSSSDAPAGRPTGAGSDATVPISDNTTRPYSDGETTPIRPTLGSPAFGSPNRGWSAARTSGSTDGDADNADTVDDVPVGSARPGSADRAPIVRDERNGRNDLPASWTARGSSRDDEGRGDDRDERSDARVDASGTTNTMSIPTRIADAPAEPADANETSESPYSNPVSASELRRRGADDDE